MNKDEFREKKHSFRERKSSGFADASRSFGKRENKTLEQDNHELIVWDKEKRSSGYKNSWQTEFYLKSDSKNSKSDEEKQFKDIRKRRNMRKKNESGKKVSKKFSRKLEKYLNPKTPDMNSSEYQGDSLNNNVVEQAEKAVRPVKKSLAVTVVAAVKLAIKFLTTKIGMVMLFLTITVTTAIMVIQSTTYNFIVDEESMIRELMSDVLTSFNNDIQEKKIEYDCDTVLSSGELADWKEVIAFWWTIKMNVSDYEQWENYFDGDDVDDLKYIFYEFNHIEYAVQEASIDENTAGKKILKVTITNSTLEELEKEWALSKSQQSYLHELIEDDEIWDELFGTSELSKIAFNEIGNGYQKYVEWYDNAEYEASSLFVAYCLAQIGCINEGYISVSENASEFKAQMKDIGFLKYRDNHKPQEGDVVFLKVNKEIKVGIVSRIYENDLYITICGYNGNTIVEEIVLDKTSGIIDSYARIESFYVLGITHNGNAENVINVAESYIGVCDGYTNNVIFNTHYYGHEVEGDDYSWCCTFVWDIFRMSGCSYAFYNGGKTADCPTVLQWAEIDGLVIPPSMAQRGDIILFDFNGNMVADHIGIVYDINPDGSFETIEGNTGYTNPTNGGEVMKRTRYSCYKIIRPEY